MHIAVWLVRESVYHPRGYFRLARSLAKRWPVEVWGRPMPPIAREGPLQAHVEEQVWHRLTAPPADPGLRVVARKGPPPPPQGPVVVCNPAGLWLSLRWPRHPLVWDVWEAYEENFRWDPAYTAFQRKVRQMAWRLLAPLRRRPQAYWLAEYTYAGWGPLARSEFLPNAFVPVESEKPLLPKLQGEYTLYTGNLAESWGLEAILAWVRAHPQEPFVLAGSVKSAVLEARIRLALETHKAWLWIRSRFVPYPVIQNLQRGCKRLLAPYVPLPHLRDKWPGKFYEAAALGLAIEYPKGVSPAWDAFWARYREDPHAPELYWSYHEGRLLAAMEGLLERFYERG